ncbi:MAG: helix-turn-helix domain-containing protein [Coriobacteriales bacterium]
MIKSRRQLTVAQRKMKEIDVALQFAIEPGERTDLERLCHQLRHEIQEYEAITRKYVSSFQIRSVDDLSDALIKARLYRGLSQKQLAGLLGVSEQMVQRDEAGGYEKASLVRLAETADALQFGLTGDFRPAERMAATDAVPTTSSHAVYEVTVQFGAWANLVGVGSTDTHSRATFSLGGEL